MDLLKILHRRHKGASALFLCRAFCYISMVGRTGALQSAPVSMRPVRSTLSGSTTHEIDLSGGGDKHCSSEVALWLRPSPRLTRYFPFPLTPTLISPYWPTVVKNSPGLRQKATIRR
ncbi:ash family protein [Salmonella enterica]|nr:ash family protein [Salmonella enterica]HCM2010527.1 ash family protein [Salmonella enterica subsp. houtenae serovar 18:z36,z38:-]EIM3880472.1 ash family protein [Salmonella enterica]EJL5626534.1 ash family protein [Salmonella enterica]EJL5734590.1 ash family protein [Salmonella enterica]